MEKHLSLFKALSDETRLKIVGFLLEGEKCVCRIHPHVKRSQSTVSIQLNKLMSLGILSSRRQGKYIYYSVANKDVKRIFDALKARR